jgi:hypothetical protein
MDLCVLGIGAQLLDRPDLNLAWRKHKIHGVGGSRGRGDAYWTAPLQKGASTVAMSGNQKRPRGFSSGRNSSMIKGYVKGARNVNRKCESVSHFVWVASAWIPQTQPGLGGFLTKILKSTFGTSGARTSFCYLCILSETRFRLASRWIPR